MKLLPILFSALVLTAASQTLERNVVTTNSTASITNVIRAMAPKAVAGSNTTLVVAGTSNIISADVGTGYVASVAARYTPTNGNGAGVTNLKVFNLSSVGGAAGWAPLIQPDGTVTWGPAGGGGTATNAIANTNGLGATTRLVGVTTADKVVGTNFTGDGGGLSNVIASELLGSANSIAEWYDASTNLTVSIYGTNGQVTAKSFRLMSSATVGQVLSVQGDGLTLAPTNTQVSVAKAGLVGNTNGLEVDLFLNTNAVQSIAGSATDPASTTNVSTAVQLIAAVKGATSGQTVYVSPGVYVLFTNNLVLGKNVSLIGAGKWLVTMTGCADCSGIEQGIMPTAGPQICPGDNSVISGFTLCLATNDFVAMYATNGHSGAWSAIGTSFSNPPSSNPSTNVLMKSIRIIGGPWDGFHANHFTYMSWTIDDCYVENESLGASFVDGSSVTNGNYRIRNSTFVSRGWLNTLPDRPVNASAFLQTDRPVTVEHCTGIITGTNSGPVFGLTSADGQNLYSVNVIDSQFWGGTNMTGKGIWMSTLAPYHLRGSYSWNGTNYDPIYLNGGAITNAFLLGGGVWPLTGIGRSYTNTISGLTSSLQEQIDAHNSVYAFIDPDPSFGGVALQVEANNNGNLGGVPGIYAPTAKIDNLIGGTLTGNGATVAGLVHSTNGYATNATLAGYTTNKGGFLYPVTGPGIGYTNIISGSSGPLYEQIDAHNGAVSFLDPDDISGGLALRIENNFNGELGGVPGIYAPNAKIDTLIGAPAGSGANLTALRASQLTGTAPQSTYPVALTNNQSTATAITVGTRTWSHDGTHTLITNTATLTSSEWTGGSQFEWYNGSKTITIDKTNGNITATNFIGSGASLTALNGSQVTSGTVPDARLSPNVAKLDAANVFTNTMGVSNSTFAVGVRVGTNGNIDASGNVTAGGVIIGSVQINNTTQSTTKGLIPVVDNSYDFGNASVRFRSSFWSGTMSNSATIVAASGFASYRSNLLAATTFTVPATNVNWTNPLTVGIEVYVDGQGATSTAFKKNGGTIFSIIPTCAVSLQSGEYISATYSVAPTASTWSWSPK